MSDLPATTGNIIDAIKQAIKHDDSLTVSRLLPELINIEPSKWLTLLYIGNIIPEPGSKNFRKVVGTLLDAFGNAIKTSSIPTTEFLEIVVSLFSLDASFISIRERLEALNLWEKPGIQVIFRYAAFLEDQVYLFEKTVQKDAKNQGYYLPTTLYADDKSSDMPGETYASILASYETNCENLQLTLAYCLHRYGTTFFGKPVTIESPYGDPEFKRLVVLATTWRNYKELWGRIKFQGWKPRSYSDDSSVIIYVPPDMEEFIRFEVGSIRLQQILSEISTGFLQLSTQHSDTPEIIEQIAKSVTIPAMGQVWNGEMDVLGFKKAISKTRNFIFGLLLLDYFHYRTVVESEIIGPPNQRIRWENYFFIVNALKVLANIINQAVANQVFDDRGSPELNRIIFVMKSRLIELLVSCSHIEQIECEHIISLLTFDPKHTDIEIWDSPLILADEGLLLFVPALIDHGSPVRSVENCIAQWNHDLFQKRGKILEEEIKNSLQLIPSIKVQSPVIFNAVGEKGSIECDLVVVWDSYLIFIEAKCTKSVFAPADFYRAKDRVEYAIHQLHRRRQMALQNWDSFRLAAQELKLPPEPFKVEQIKLIVVTNVLHFTGWQTNDVIITDEFCLHRFFDENQNVEVFLGNDSIGSIAQIRKSKAFKVLEFLEYIKRPPQVESVKAEIRTEISPLMVVKNGDPKVGILKSRYVPSDKIALLKEKTPLTKSTKRHKHHRCRKTGK